MSEPKSPPPLTNGQGMFSDGARSPRQVFLLIASIKAYGLVLMYVLFLRTDLREDDQGFIFVPKGETRAERLEEIRDRFWERLAPYDGQWYMDVGFKGYRRLTRTETIGRKLPPGNHAFFPLLPGLIRAVKLVAGDAFLPVSLMLVIVASAGGALVVWFLARQLRINAWLTVVLLLTFPSAAFQLVLYTEGLFLLLSSLAILFAFRRQVVLAGLFGCLAGLCRPQGILLTLPLAVELLRPGAREAQRSVQATLGRIAAAVMPLSGFAVMTARHSLGFVEIQREWGRSYGAFNVFDALGSAVGYGGPPADLLGLVIGLAFLPVMWRRLPTSLALYGTAAVLLPLLTGSLLSFGRFISMSIPHFLCLALFLQTRERLRNILIVAFVAFQVLLAKGLVGWYLVG